MHVNSSSSLMAPVVPVCLFLFETTCIFTITFYHHHRHRHTGCRHLLLPTAFCTFKSMFAHNRNIKADCMCVCVCAGTKSATGNREYRFNGIIKVPKNVCRHQPIKDTQDKWMGNVSLEHYCKRKRASGTAIFFLYSLFQHMKRKR